MEAILAYLRSLPERWTEQQHTQAADEVLDLESFVCPVVADVAGAAAKGWCECTAVAARSRPVAVMEFAAEALYLVATAAMHCHLVIVPLPGFAVAGSGSDLVRGCARTVIWVGTQTADPRSRHSSVDRQ